MMEKQVEKRSKTWLHPLLTNCRSRGIILEKSASNLIDTNRLITTLKGEDVVVLNAGLLTDPKLLLGTFSVVDEPGSFRWREGYLLEAIRKGTTLVLEDIHLATNELLVMLHQLVGDGLLYDTQAAVNVRAHPDFQIIATCSDSQHNNSLLHYQIDACLWTVKRVDLEMSLLDYFLCECNLPESTTLLLLDLHNQSQKEIPYAKDLFDRCKVSFLVEESERRLVFQTLQSVYQECSSEFFEYARGKLALEEINLTLDTNLESVTIGAIACKKIGESMTTEGVSIQPSTIKTLSHILSAVSNSKPVLLVGETGTGKTTIVQFFAHLLGQKNLHVLNISQQSEASDLLGGYKPLSKVCALKAIYTQFHNFFAENFSIEKNEQLFSALAACISQNNSEKFLDTISMVLEKLGYASKGFVEFSTRFDSFKKQVANIDAGAIFCYEEGILIKAIKLGHWILLDELNLATTEVLQVVNGILCNRDMVNIITDAGQKLTLKPHPHFQLFACMNPATDYGKKDLPGFLRRLFAEIFVPEIDTHRDEFENLIRTSLGADFVHQYDVAPRVIADIYYELKNLAEMGCLVGEEGKKPLLNLRSLTRALKYAGSMVSAFGHKRALYEGLLMAFSTFLLEKPYDLCLQVVKEHIYPSSALPNLRNAASNTAGFIMYAGFPLKTGKQNMTSLCKLEEEYIITDSVKKHISNLARAISSRLCPILLEGPTSSGKTSSIYFLARFSGNKLIRINNHEHTELSEYIGSYSVNPVDGSLFFKDGFLVEALKEGYWLLLDELNLAPSEVLEALNRLLDDNRELYIPETSETIRPHPNFALFATQNPAGSLYGGRKHLSRAFRSRFLELHVPSIPSNEMQTILAKKCKIAPSQAKKLTTVYEVLQEKRTVAGNVFAGRNALITLRDLFRWASRKYDLNEDLAMNGVDLLCERCRTDTERSVILQAIQEVFKADLQVSLPLMSFDFDGISWTFTMKRLFSLCLKAIENKESILLVGETGCGKTTVCYLLKEYLKRSLVTMNCHQNTETSDFLGTFRPCREKSTSKLFEFYEGPLVTSMRQGSIFLMDEISLAEDSVLESLNSVLETERTLTITEGNEQTQVIKATEGFVFVGTMNPGGDFGKKELSPALRSRFTEIWVNEGFLKSDLLLIVKSALQADDDFIELITNVFLWIKEACGRMNMSVSLRDLNSLMSFLRSTKIENSYFLEGLELVFFDRPGMEQLCNMCLQTFGFDLGEKISQFVQNCGEFGIEPYFYAAPLEIPQLETSFNAPTTLKCARRILRAMKIRKPVLLEGPPGVGKTTIVSALSQASGSSLCRINLSEQSDLNDLFGSELPVPNGLPGQFAWVDGPFLTAIQKGDWVLLDEINLASQSVLEGLNAVLDHRGEAYIPELDRSFKIHSKTRIFAAQNPVFQGGNRKSLPKSFLNRFTVVWFQELTFEDYRIILNERFPNFPQELIDKCIEFVRRVSEILGTLSGGPWELNLRDLFRWLSFGSELEKYVKPVIISRFRTEEERRIILSIFEQVFEIKVPSYTDYTHANGELRIGSSSIGLKSADIAPLSFQLSTLEAIIHNVSRGSLTIVTGVSGSGKSTLINFLADNFGHKCNELFLSPETDTLELLGSFAQFDPRQHFLNLLKLFNVEAKEDVEGQCSRIFTPSHNMYNEYQQVLTMKASSSGRFEWQDGALVRAVENGEWLILSQANLASSAVLDRLNSLFEPNGCLYLPEQGALPDGTIRIICPHPNFRCFFTYDPKFGEISRAMRNRGVEINLDIQQSDLLDQYKLNQSNNLILNVRSLREHGMNELVLSDQVVEWWLSQRIHPSLRFDPSVSFDSNNAIVEFFRSIKWTVEKLTKTLLFEEMASFFGKPSVTVLALYLKGKEGLELEAPSFYEKWLTCYRPLAQVKLQAESSLLKDSFDKLSRFVSLLNGQVTQSISKDLVDVNPNLYLFCFMSELFSMFSFDDLVAVFCSCGLKVLLKQVIEDIKKCSLASLPYMTASLASLKSFLKNSRFSISELTFDNQKSDILNELASDPNIIWENRLTAKGCVKEVFEEELFIRKCFLFFKIGQKYVSLSAAEDQLQQLSEIVNSLHCNSIIRNQQDLQAFFFSVSGLQAFLKNGQVENALMIRRKLWNMIRSTCVDLVPLVCSQVDNMLWDCIVSKKLTVNERKTKSFKAIEFYIKNTLTKESINELLHSLVVKLAEEHREMTVQCKEMTEEEEDNEIIEKYISHQEVADVTETECFKILTAHKLKTSEFLELYAEMNCKDLSSQVNLSDTTSQLYGLSLQITRKGTFYNSVDDDLLTNQLCHLNNLINAAEALLGEHYNHDVLLEVVRLTNSLLESNLNNTSMISVLLALERIVSKADDWQKFADSSRKLPLDPLIDWILEYRKLEATSWPHLLEGINSEMEQKAVTVGLRFLELAVNAKPTKELLESVDAFIIACPVGQFIRRLEILELASHHSSLLVILHAYYSFQIQPKLQSYLSQIQRSVEEELKLFLQTMKWTDRNIYAMQMSVKKGHSALAKILRKYKDAISRPISAIISENTNIEVHKAEFNSVLSKLISPDESTFSNNIYERTSMALYSLEQLKLPINNFIETIKVNLESLTSKPMQAKKAALVTFFKAIKQSGIKIHKPVPESASLSHLLYTAGLNGVPVKDGFLKLLGKWNDLELALQQPHPDVSPREMDLARNILFQFIQGIQSVKQVSPLLLKKLQKGSFILVDNNELETILITSKRLADNAALDPSFAKGIEEKKSIMEAVICASDGSFLIPTKFQDVKFSEHSEEIQRGLLLYLQRLISLNCGLMIDEECEFGNLADILNLSNQMMTVLSEAVNFCQKNVIAIAKDQSLVMKQLLNALECVFDFVNSLLLCVSHLGVVLGNVFIQLVQNGYCRPSDAPVGEDSKLDDGKLEEGTGMADGQGEKNVSKELEFEEQITDLQKDEEKETKPETENSKDDEEHVEMEQDFEAVLNDLMENDTKLDDDGDGEADDDNKPLREGDMEEGGDIEEVDPTWWNDEQDGQEDKEQNKNTREGEKQLVGDEPDADHKKDTEGAKMEEELNNSGQDVQDQEAVVNGDENEDMISESEEQLGSEEESAPMEQQNDEEEGDFDMEQLEEIEEQDEEGEEEVKTELPSMYSKPEEETLPEQLFNEDTSGDGTGQQSPQDSSNSDQQEPKYHSLDARGSGELMSAQTDTQKLKPQQRDSRKGISAKNPVLRSLHDILREEWKQEAALMNQNIASLQQQYTEAESGLEVLGSAQGGSYGKFADIQDNSNEKMEVDEDVQENEKTEKAEKELLSNTQKQMISKEDSSVKEDTESDFKLSVTWRQLLMETDMLASSLCEQLRLIMVPTVAARLKGDYKSGKRLNIRKILPFIASGYRRDKIWLRRTKLSNRNYRVALAIDNSQSMRNSGAGEMALKAAGIIYGALKKLETGDVFSILSFGTSANLLKLDEVEKDKTLDSVFSFGETQTNLSEALDCVLTLSDSSSQLLAIYISDGVCSNHEQLRQKIATQRSKSIVSLFVIIDCAPGKQSITELTRVDRHPQTGKLLFQKYLWNFPFEFYIVVQDIGQLPNLVSEALLQWFRSIQQHQ